MHSHANYRKHALKPTL